MKFTKWIFVIAGSIGMLTLFPLLFKEHAIAPGLVYPEFYFGIIGVKILLQIMYIHISDNPIRFKPIIFFGFLIKITTAVTFLSLIYFERTSSFWLYPAIGELVFAILFLISFFLLKKHETTE